MQRNIRKTGDQNVNALRNTTVLSAVYLNVHSSVFSSSIRDMMKNLNEISTLFKGVTYTRVMASREEKVRKLRSRHAYVSSRMNAAITNRVKTAVETCRWWKTTRNRCFTEFRDDLCCQNSTLENKKAIRDDKLTRVLGEGKCLFIDTFSRFLKIQTVINFKNLECIQILLLFRIFLSFLVSFCVGRKFQSGATFF